MGFNSGFKGLKGRRSQYSGQAMDWTVWSFHFRQTQDLYLFSKMLPFLGPTQPHIQWFPKLFPRVKRPGNEIDHSPPSSVEIKTDWRYTLILLHAFVKWAGKTVLFTITLKLEGHSHSLQSIICENQRSYLKRIIRRVRENFEKRLLTSWCLRDCLSFRPHGTTRLPLKGFSWNLTFDYFLRICREKFDWNLTRITVILREDICTFMIISRSSVLRMRNGKDKFVKKSKTHIIFFLRIVPFIR